MRENPRFAQEAGAGGAGEPVLGADRLHRDDALQLLVEGAVDLAHAAHAEQALEAEVADGGADEAHSVGLGERNTSATLAPSALTRNGFCRKAVTPSRAPPRLSASSG